MSAVTIKDVAAAAEVSVGTASMALNGKKNISSETREKVLEVADRLGYKPNRYARFLTSKHTHTIGLIITDITNPFFGLLTDYIQQNLDEQGYDLMLGISAGSITKEKDIVDKFISLWVDGVICVPSHKASEDVHHFRELQKRGIPLCFITTYYNDVNAPCVMTDLSAGSYSLTKHLLKNGHRSIFYIVANLALPLAKLRVEGYRAAFAEVNIPLSDNWIIEDVSTFEGGYHAVDEILRIMKPDAILSMNDIIALGVMKRLKECGYHIPEDISVAGYDDLIYTTLLETPLTTVQQPVSEMCKRVVSILIERIDHPELIGEKILLAPKLVIRESTRSLNKE
ncbi:LacI family transcriptional regulator [Lachnospiraceae bacterium ZAX-1]